MTSRQVYEALLIESNKVQAPAILLEDFIYFANKAIGQYFNKRYNLYDISQQLSDDLRVLKSTAVLIPQRSPISTTSNNLFRNTYEVYLPDDYVHILGCILEYQITSATYKCLSLGDVMQYSAKRLTADMFPGIMNNYYMKPSYKNPYYYINNTNTNNEFPTADSQINVTNVENGYKFHITGSPDGTLSIKKTATSTPIVFTFQYAYTGEGTFSNFTNLLPQLISLLELTSEQTWIDVNNDLFLYNVYSITNNSPVLTATSITRPIPLEVEKTASIRYGNKSKVKMELRYGNNTTNFYNSKVYIDYLKAPQYLELTQDQIDLVEDTSQLLEFPDYVCQEIINELTKLLLESASDPRLQTNIPINQTIGNPQQR